MLLMSNKLGLFCGFVIIVFSFYTCIKPPTYDDVPEVEFLSFSKDTVVQFTDFVTFEIGFKDGDGDLGREDSILNMFIIDNRRSDTLTYQIPVIPKEGVGGSISGSIEVDISQICCVSNQMGIPVISCFLEQPNVFDPITYSIYIVDNAGNISNTIQSDTLYVQCFE
jgi:hypothetical protein